MTMDDLFGGDDGDGSGDGSDGEFVDVADVATPEKPKAKANGFYTVMFSR